MKDLIACDLILPLSTVHFFGPKPSSSSSPSSPQTQTYPRRHKIRGKIRLVTSKPIKLKQVQIKFKGVTQLTWREKRSGGGILPLIGDKMDATKALRKNRQVLLEDAPLPAGVTELGFELSIPGYLPPTFNNEFLAIKYFAVAKIVPASKFDKLCRVERQIEIQKTLFPKDVSIGLISGFVTPRISYRGERPGVCRWKFWVPRYVLMGGDGVNFEGSFETIPANDNNENASRRRPSLQIDKISIDLVQEELYRTSSSVSEAEKLPSDVSSFLFPSGSEPKRHLILPTITPSTYLYPPLSTKIQFSFPLPHPSHMCQQQLKPSMQLTRSESASSVPTISHHGSLRVTRLRRVSNSLSNLAALANSQSMITKDTTLYQASLQQTVSTKFEHHPFTYSLESPFLTIAHYIRVVVHFQKDANGKDVEPPLCIGLPINITQNISPNLPAEETLPTYQEVVRESERLPGYCSNGDNSEDDDDYDAADNNNDNNNNNNDSNNNNNNSNDNEVEHSEGWGEYSLPPHLIIPHGPIARPGSRQRVREGEDDDDDDARPHSAHAHSQTCDRGQLIGIRHHPCSTRRNGSRVGQDGRPMSAPTSLRRSRGAEVLVRERCLGDFIIAES